MTKRFVQQVTEPEETKETIQHFLQETATGKTIQLSFVGQAAEQPLITEMIRNFDVDVNILQGKISQTKDGAYGSLFIHIDGQEKEVENVIRFIKDKQVEAEVITNV